MVKKEKRKMMIEKIGAPAMLEQLAEEAVELAKASLKLARVIREENPTPVSREEAFKAMTEEYTDTVQCAMELQLRPNYKQMLLKQKRFMNRWEAMTY